MYKPGRERHDDRLHRIGAQASKDAHELGRRIIEDEGAADRWQAEQRSDRVGRGKDGGAVAGPQHGLGHQRFADAAAQHDRHP